jgi:hypothetical protein
VALETAVMANGKYENETCRYETLTLLVDTCWQLQGPTLQVLS